jgi:repressor LexA
MTALTPRQLDILQAISEAIEAQGFPPTLREIGGMLGLTGLSGVSFHLDSLERKGAIRLTPRVSRSAVLTDLGREWLAGVAE